MQRSPRFHPSRLSGFSLLELLIAVSILGLLILIIAQIVNGAMRTTSASRKKIDVDNEVRRIFDRMAYDFSSMLNRSDTDFVVHKVAGNDKIYFFSENPARLTATSGSKVQPISLVGYRINEEFESERFSQGLTWDLPAPEGPVFLTLDSTITPTSDQTYLPASTIEGAYATPLGATDKYHVIGEGIFRLEIDFLLKPTGNLPAEYSTTPYRETTFGGPYTNHSISLKEVQGIVVTIAVLDGSSRQLVDNLQPLTAKFPDTVDGEIPSTKWQSIAEDAASLDIHKDAAGQVRVYQRIFPIH